MNLAETILLCATEDEGRALRVRGMCAVSVRQSLTRDGGFAAAVYATEAARSHPDYSKALTIWQRNVCKMRLPAGVERVI